MNKIVMIKFAAAILVSAIWNSSLNGQELNDVITKYNEGAKAAQTDVGASIAAFEDAILLADKVGEPAADLKQKAMKVLPGLYVKLASKALSEKKPATEVIKAARNASAAAEKYGSTTSKENAGKLLVQGYYVMGTEYFTKKEYDNALLAFDTLLQINPDYAAAIYNKALVYRTQNNSAAFEETIDSYLGKLEAGKDDERKKQASGLALEYFRAAGSQANQANNLDEALGLLNKAAKYGEDKDLFYFFADVYNKQKNFSSGAEYAQKGLDLETGEAEAKAKYYFQLGLALSGKGQTTEACEAFKNAQFGAFTEASKAERKNLKCQ